MQQKDFVVTFTVLGRTVHKIIVRTTDATAAKRIARSVVNDMSQLTDNEFCALECFTEPFNHLDSHEFFVCF